MSFLFDSLLTLFSSKAESQPLKPNLIKYPLFDGGYSSSPPGEANWKWLINSSANVVDGVLYHPTQGRNSSIFIQTPKANQKYKVSVTMSGVGAKFFVREYNTTAATLNSTPTFEHAHVEFPNSTIEFTSQPTTVKIAFVCSSNKLGEFNFRKPYFCEM